MFNKIKAAKPYIFSNEYDKMFDFRLLLAFSWSKLSSNVLDNTQMSVTFIDQIYKQYATKTRNINR